jgi:hypothetical protein
LQEIPKCHVACAIVNQHVYAAAVDLRGGRAKARDDLPLLAIGRNPEVKSSVEIPGAIRDPAIQLEPGHVRGQKRHLRMQQRPQMARGPVVTVARVKPALPNDAVYAAGGLGIGQGERQRLCGRDPRHDREACEQRHHHRHRATPQKVRAQKCEHEWRQHEHRLHVAERAFVDDPERCVLELGEAHPGQARFAEHDRRLQEKTHRHRQGRRLGFSRAQRGDARGHGERKRAPERRIVRHQLTEVVCEPR